MNSSRPYLLRAIYEWIVDNQLTPYIIVNAVMSDVTVPERCVENGKIVLNIEPQAIGCLRMGNDAVEFDARFSGNAHHIFIPIQAIKAIYAFENSHGIIFAEDEYSSSDNNDSRISSYPSNTRTVGMSVKKSRLPNLKIVK